MFYFLAKSGGKLSRKLSAQPWFHRSKFQKHRSKFQNGLFSGKILNRKFSRKERAQLSVSKAIVPLCSRDFEVYEVNQKLGKILSQRSRF